MPAQIINKKDVFDQATNQIIIPEGAEGTVSSVAFPPRPIQFYCQFVVGVATVYRWLREDEIAFKDGPVGAVRALLADRNYQLSDIYYPTLISDTDLILGTAYHAMTDRVELRFSAGTILRISANQNTGELVFELDHQD